MNPYYMVTPNAFEAALRQKEGELASYMSRLVWTQISHFLLFESLLKPCFNFLN